MREVAEEAREKDKLATEAYLAQMRRDIEHKQLQWGAMIKDACNVN